MAMNRAQRRRIENLIKEISSGTFSLSDVRMLFMDLREHSQNNPVFREYADFVAHSKRDRGIIWEALQFYRNKGQYMSDHFMAGTSLDVTQPFPLYVKEMFAFIVKRLHPSVLTDSNLTQADFDQFVKNEILPVPNTNTFQFSPSILQKIANNEPVPVLKVLYPMVDDVRIMPEAISFEELFDGLLTAIRSNGVQFNEPALVRQFDKITLLVLADLHKSEYTMKDNTVVVCKIKGMQWKIVRNETGVGTWASHLHLAAELPAGEIKEEGVKLPMQLLPVVIGTKLPCTKWCTANTFIDFGDRKGGDSDHDFDVQDFKLTPILPYMGAGIVDVDF